MHCAPSQPVYWFILKHEKKTKDYYQILGESQRQRKRKVKINKRSTGSYQKRRIQGIKEKRIFKTNNDSLIDISSKI